MGILGLCPLPTRRGREARLQASTAHPEFLAAPCTCHGAGMGSACGNGRDRTRAPSGLWRERGGGLPSITEQPGSRRPHLALPLFLSLHFTLSPSGIYPIPLPLGQPFCEPQEHFLPIPPLCPFQATCAYVHQRVESGTGVLRWSPPAPSTAPTPPHSFI